MKLTEKRNYIVEKPSYILTDCEGKNRKIMKKPFSLLPKKCRASVCPSRMPEGFCSTEQSNNQQIIITIKMQM